VNESAARRASTLTPTVPTAVIAFDFDPLVRLGDGAVAWETIGIAAAILAGLVVAGMSARSARLRADDLLFVVLGVVPGAVVGGRLGYVLLHPSYFLADPGRIVDPGAGSLELTLAVVGAALTGSLVAVLLDGRPGPWLHIAALPALLVLGLAKIASVLGGTGQGLPTSGEPATAYVGTGPWGSLGPAIPSVPSQALEGLATLLVLGLLLVLSLASPLRRADGRRFVVALALWASVRAAVATTWRDAVVIGPLRAEQVIDGAVVAGCVVLLVMLAARSRGAGSEASGRRHEEPLGATRASS
jgi:phosphatidylglycerol---prolipoprotein diacylglyceryl transferase